MYKNVPIIFSSKSKKFMQKTAQENKKQGRKPSTYKLKIENDEFFMNIFKQIKGDAYDLVIRTIV